MGGRTPETLRVACLAALLLVLGLGTPPMLAAQQPLRGLVVIDPGHGGDDEGARGPAGTLEKDVTLAVALELARILASESDLEVRLTRDRDTLVALSDRPRLANRWREGGGVDRPALFLSIHANAHESRAVRGLETYFLADALTDEARRVAERENASARFDEPGGDGGRDALAFIFNDLRQNRYLHESSAWAGRVQRTLVSRHGGPDRGVKQARFVVLGGAFMPAILVELGFVSHPGEERSLADPNMQRSYARSLADAVLLHFPAHGYAGHEVQDPEPTGSWTSPPGEG